MMAMTVSLGRRAVKATAPLPHAGASAWSGISTASP